MADNDVIGGLDNLIDTVSGDTPSYTIKDPNVDMVKAIDKCIDAAKGITGSTYEYKDPNTDVIQKMDELAEAISESGGGGSATLIEKSVTSNGTYKASEDEADGYSKVSVSVSPNVGTKSITENGTYTASSDSLDGYSSVTVEVESNDEIVIFEDGEYKNSDKFAVTNSTTGASGISIVDGNLVLAGARGNGTGVSIAPVDSTKRFVIIFDYIATGENNANWIETGLCVVGADAGACINSGTGRYSYHDSGYINTGVEGTWTNINTGTSSGVFIGINGEITISKIYGQFIKTDGTVNVN